MYIQASFSWLSGAVGKLSTMRRELVSSTEALSSNYNPSTWEKKTMSRYVPAASFSSGASMQNLLGSLIALFKLVSPKQAFDDIKSVLYSYLKLEKSRHPRKYTKYYLSIPWIFHVWLMQIEGVTWKNYDRLFLSCPPSFFLSMLLIDIEGCLRFLES